MLRPILTLLAPLALAACAADNGAVRYDLEEIAAQHERDLQDLHRAQAALEARTEIPQRIDFGDAGSILIDQLELVGRPGKVFLRMHFTWVNTGGKAYPVVDARLTLRDAASETEWAETVEMRLPFRYSLTPDSSYTSWFETPTRGVHLRDGWQWELNVRPYERDPLLDGTRD